MNLFGYEITLSRKSAETIDINTFIQRLEAVYSTASGVSVTPDTALQSPTVLAIVTAISRRIATLPVRVLKKAIVNGRTTKTEQPDHPISRLLSSPNDINDRVNFWLDCTSWLLRYGNYYAFKSRGQTGPIRQLIPLHPGHVNVTQDNDLVLHYKVTQASGSQVEYTSNQIMHVRGAAKNGYRGDSPITQIREAIALEIAAERMGAAVFGNSAIPSLVLQFAQGAQGFKSDEERMKFVDSLQQLYSKGGRFRSMLLPKGIEIGQQVAVDNEKAQFLNTRQYQRTVIAGAFGVPPHLVGDLSKGTLNNVEQQSLDFDVNVTLPYARIFEAAMETSLLTDQDRRSGIIIRFNLDASLRADYKSRQEGLSIQRNAGVVNPNDWREHEGMNPISKEDGGEDYWRKGPSGQTADPPSPTPTNPSPDDTEDDGAAT